jgi:general stress protein 26
MPKNPQIDWHSKVKEALDRTDIMALSTIGDDGSWTSPVQYRYGPKLELYFESMNETKHVENIRNDPRVSVAIYWPEEFPGGGNLGLQIRGTAEELPAEDNDPSAESALWHTFKVTPDEVWCFDSRASRERQKIELAELTIGER